MSDLTDRLRAAQWAKLTRQLCHEAADALDAKDAEIQSLKEKLNNALTNYGLPKDNEAIDNYDNDQ
jgi:hypothetical protein